MNPLPELDAVFTQASQPEHLGEISSAEQIEKVQSVLKLYDATKVNVVSDKSTKITSLTGHGGIIVGLLLLSHEAY
jgi:cell division protein FtsX